VSRERRSLRFAPAVVGIALALAGCSAGQISQTASMEAAVNGSNANIGAIAVRDIQLAYPEHGVYQAGEQALILGSIVNSGQNADELLSISSPEGEVVVSGDKSLAPGRSLIAELPAGGITRTPVATTPSAPATTSGAPTTTSGSATSGSATSGPATSGSSTSGSATSGSSTSTTTTTTTTSAAPKSIGKVTIVLTLKEELRSGKNVELTFTFRSGQVTVLVPIAVPTTPRKPAVTEGH
jgi:copper(I)-binding protein